jgi:KDO2-lipid IV(A) lauroyltransferase
MADNEWTADLSTDGGVPVSPTASRDAPHETQLKPLGTLTRAKFALVRGFLWGWARLFSLGGLYQLGVVFGTCEWLCDYKRRRRVRQRVDEIFADRNDAPPAGRVVRRQFIRSRCDKLLYLVFDKIPKDKILARLEFRGEPDVKRALAKGRGAAVVMAHFGPHHLAFLLTALLGYRMIGVRDRKEGSLRRYVQEQLEKSFPEYRAVRWFYVDDYPRELFRSLREGYVLSSALDVSPTRGGNASTTTVRIFGKEQAFRDGTMRLAARRGAPVMQAYIVARPNYRFQLSVTPPLIDGAPGEVDEDVITAAMQQYADNVERHARRHPCHLSRF